MEIITVTPTIILALDLVPTPATRGQHFPPPPPLHYHANHSPNCKTVYPCYHGDHGVLAATVSVWDMVPTSAPCGSQFKISLLRCCFNTAIQQDDLVALTLGTTSIPNFLLCPVIFELKHATDWRTHGRDQPTVRSLMHFQQRTNNNQSSKSIKGNNSTQSHWCGNYIRGYCYSQQWLLFPLLQHRLLIFILFPLFEQHFPRTLVYFVVAVCFSTDPSPIEKRQTVWHRRAHKMLPFTLQHEQANGPNEETNTYNLRCTLIRLIISPY